MSLSVDCETKAIAADLTAGTIGGCMGILVGSPFDCIKLRLQTASANSITSMPSTNSASTAKPIAPSSTSSISTTNTASSRVYKSTLDCFLTTVRTEGALSLFKGCASPLLAASPINATMFAVNAYSLRKLNKSTLSHDELANPHSSSTYYRNVLISGSIAGLATIPFSAPSELVKCRMQVQIDELKSKPTITQSHPSTTLTAVNKLASSSKSNPQHSNQRQLRSHPPPISSMYAHSTAPEPSSHLIQRSIAQSPLHTQSTHTHSPKTHLSTNPLIDRHSHRQHTHLNSSALLSRQSALHSSATAYKSAVGSGASYSALGVAQTLNLPNRHPQPVYTSSLDCARQIYRLEGLYGLNRGFSVTALRDGFSCAIYFGVYEYTKNTLTHARVDRFNRVESSPDRLASSSSSSPSSHARQVASIKPSTLDILLAGGLAGVTSWLSCFPIDVVKSVIQTRPAPSEPHLRMLDTALACYKQYGASFFTRGLTATMLRAVPVNMATFAVYEALLTFLVPKQVGQQQAHYESPGMTTSAAIEMR